MRGNQRTLFYHLRVAIIGFTTFFLVKISLAASSLESRCGPLSFRRCCSSPSRPFTSRQFTTAGSTATTTTTPQSVIIYNFCGSGEIIFGSQPKSCPTGTTAGRRTFGSRADCSRATSWSCRIWTGWSSPGTWCARTGSTGPTQPSHMSSRTEWVSWSFFLKICIWLELKLFSLLPGNFSYWLHIGNLLKNWQNNLMFRISVTLRTIKLLFNNANNH